MLDNTIYINHMNQKVEFGKNGVYITESNARDFTWEYDSTFDEISNFRKGIVEKTATIYILQPYEEAIETANEIHSIFERDVKTETRGKMIIDGYYCSGFFISSEKPKWNNVNFYITFDVKFITDQPEWVKETKHEFQKIDGESQEYDDVKHYPNKYAYRYSNNTSTRTITNESVIDTDFVLRIYGSITNPLVMIDGNVYQVNVSLSSSDYLEINTKDKTIVVTKKNGQKVNAFWSAGRNGYIFQKMSSGSAVVSWDGTFNFDLITMETRSEPKWM